MEQKIEMDYHFLVRDTQRPVRKKSVLVQKQKQELSFLAYFSIFLEGFFIYDCIDLVETVLVLIFSS